eukprot:TRINITY_DN4634_c0_g1_i2.p1 TRINITY_DN4634_c0_g1~~TRINITY_DN4634_c0_g1_i2.p1  ORF type:complete len:476 (+),score=126.26 TRINITY_DN4634_c0_g1_i2:391-1818(+)
MHDTTVIETTTVTTHTTQSSVDSTGRSRSNSVGRSRGKADHAKDRENARRVVALRKVFQEFDLDLVADKMEPDELMQLGKARRKLGQKHSDWTEEKNARLVRKMDTNGDGLINASEFVQHFEATLPKDPEEFAVAIEQFMEVARSCRARKALSPAPSTRAPSTRPNESEKEAWSRDREAARRVAALRRVFQEFDLDDEDEIDAEELLQLGKARRKLGQKQSDWTEEKNAKLVRKMDTNGDGLVNATEFVQHFEASLPKDPQEFAAVIEQFMEVAHSCRARKLQIRTDRQEAVNAQRLSEQPVVKQVGNNNHETREDVHRDVALRRVFEEFDLDDCGVIEAAELMQLGKARRALGQKQSDWTEEKNAKLVRKMDANGDGEIDVSEFVHHFGASLPKDSQEFAAVIDQFMEVAKACRARKVQIRSEVHTKQREVGHRVNSLHAEFQEFDLDTGGPLWTAEGRERSKTGRLKGATKRD